MTSQAHPPSDAEQLHDARTANGLLRVRLAEQEALVAQYRARCEALVARLGEASVVVEYRATYGKTKPSAVSSLGTSDADRN